uniref:hypothetical protein n=1 Tax=Fervidobacterium ngatamarikiense TaxID=3389972 RepID=UPI00396473FE
MYCELLCVKPLIRFRSDYEGWKPKFTLTVLEQFQKVVLEVTMRDGNKISLVGCALVGTSFVLEVTMRDGNLFTFGATSPALISSF